MSVLPFDVFKVPTRSCDRYKKDYLDNEIQRQKREIQKCIKVRNFNIWGRKWTSREWLRKSLRRQVSGTFITFLIENNYNNPIVIFQSLNRIKHLPQFMCVPNRVNFRNAQILYMCPGEKRTLFNSYLHRNRSGDKPNRTVIFLVKLKLM